jgi:hypothetical protein
MRQAEFPEHCVYTAIRHTTRSTRHTQKLNDLKETTEEGFWRALKHLRLLILLILCALVINLNIVSRSISILQGLKRIIDHICGIDWFDIDAH